MSTERLGITDISDDVGGFKVIVAETVYLFKEPVLGLDSYCRDGHFGMFDSDGENVEHVLWLAERVARNFDVTVLVFESSKGHHHYLIPNENSKNDLLKLAGYMADSIDLTHFGLGLVRGFWTLRLSSKNGDRIKFLFYQQAMSEYCMQRGLNELFKEMFPAETAFRDAKTDDDTIIQLRRYWT